MVNLRNLTTKSLAISTIRKVVSALASLLLIISMTSPFCSVGTSGYFGIANAKQGSVFWSYRSDFTYSSGIFLLGPIHRQYWFSDYWFSYLDRDLLKLTWMVMPMFVLQVLTLVFGIISIISKRRILSLAPVCLSVIVPALMIYTINRLFEISQFGNYEQGYYFSYYPVGLFLSAFVLNEMIKKRQTKPTGDSSISTTGTTHTNASNMLITDRTKMKNFYDSLKSLRNNHLLEVIGLFRVKHSFTNLLSLFQANCYFGERRDLICRWSSHLLLI